MILDANVLLYAADRRSQRHEIASSFLAEVLNGATRVGLPWQTIGAYLRLVTHPRITSEPLTPTEAWRDVEAWLSAEVAGIPDTGQRTAQILGDLVQRHGCTGNLVTDAQLAALAIEHGVPVVSADSDFARFPEVRWTNPFDHPLHPPRTDTRTGEL